MTRARAPLSAITIYYSENMRATCARDHRIDGGSLRSRDIFSRCRFGLPTLPFYDPQNPKRPSSVYLYTYTYRCIIEKQKRRRKKKKKRARCEPPPPPPRIIYVIIRLWNKKHNTASRAQRVRRGGGGLPPRITPCENEFFPAEHEQFENRETSGILFIRVLY